MRLAEWIDSARRARTWVQRGLFAIALLIAAAASSDRVVAQTSGVSAGDGKRVALVIGNAAYQHTTPLTNPANDARDMAAALKDVGFQVIDGIDLDKRGLDQKVREFARALAGADSGLFFYAGHGLQVSGQNYLVPVDARLESERDLDFEAVKIDFILRQMEIDRENKTNIVFLDACRDNPLSRNLARSMGTRSAALGRGLAQVQTGVGTFLSFSTQPGNVALDGAGRNSPFTAALAKHIRTPGKNLNGLMIEVRKDVLAATQGKQVPWDHSALTGDFFFAGGPTGGAAAGASTPASGAAEVAALQERMRSLEEELKKRNSPTANADAIKIAELRARAASLVDLTKQLQSRLMNARAAEGRAADATEKARLQRESMNIQMEWSRRSLDLKKLRDELAVVEGQSGVAQTAAVPVALPGPKDGEATFVLRTATAFEGGSRIGTASKLANHTLCVDQCRKTGGCVGLQHNDQTQECQMYSTIGRRVEAANWRSGMRSDQVEATATPAAVAPATTATKGDYNIRDGSMLNGSELANARVATFDECLSRCDATQGCVGFQHEANSAVCLMFSRVTFRTGAANWRAGVKSSAAVK
jgi:uncharacterized caspase-like protein